MKHEIEFVHGCLVDGCKSGQTLNERIKLDRGQKFFVELRPGILESPNGPLEVATLYCDHDVFLNVPYEFFRFVESIA